MLPYSQGFVNLKKFKEARSMAKKILESAESMENLFAQFMGHHHLADCAIMEGKFREAEREYAMGVKTTLQYGDMHYLFTDLTGIAMSVAGQGRHAKAIRLMAAVNEGSKRAGTMSLEDFQLQFWQELIQQQIVGTRKKLGKSLTQEYESEGKELNLDETIAYALDFEKD